MSLTLLMVHLGYLGTGLLVVRLFGDSAIGFRLRRLLVSYIVGLTCQISVLYAIAAAGPAPHTLAVLLTVVGVLLWAFFSGVAIKDWWTGRPEKEQRLQLRMGDLLSPPMLLRLMLILLLLAPVFSTLMIAKTVPVFGWDGIAIWSTKAYALFNGEHLHSDFFLDKDRVHAHPGYPIALPLFEFQHQAVDGEFREILITRALVTVLLIWLLAFFDIVSEFGGRTTGIAVCVLLMYTPVFFSPTVMGYPSSGFADFPIGALVALAVGWFNSWLIKGNGIDLLGSSAALAATVGVKNEGSVWVVLVLVIGLVSIVVVRPHMRRRDLLVMSIPVVSLVALRLTHYHLPTSSDVHAPSLSEIKQLVDVIPQMVEFGVRGWLRRTRILGFLPVMVLVGYAMGIFRQWRNRNSILALVGPAMWLTIFMVMGLTEVQFGGLVQYSRVTFPRLLFQAIPVSLYWAVLMNSPLFPQSRA